MLLDQFKKGHGMSKFTKTEKLNGAMSLTWIVDVDLAQELFSDFEREYERTNTGCNETPTFKLRNTSCKDLIVIELRGYSQGDFAIVKTTKDNYTPEYRKYLNHIFWDAPVYAHIDICGNDVDQEFYISEHFADEYDTSKEGLIAAIKSCFKDNEDLKARALKLCEEFGDYADYI